MTLFGYIAAGAVPACIFLGGILFTFRLRAFYLFRPFGTLKYMLSGGRRDGIPPFRAAMMALAGTLGVGNIVGVGSAIAVGGFGAVFWMLVSAVIAMPLKYAEVTLAVKHRRRDPRTGEYSGGAHVYVRDCLASRGMPRLGAALALIFLAFCLLNSFTMGCVIQVNSVSHALEGLFGLPTRIAGAAFALLILLCVTRGAGKISAITARVVPVMTFGFLAVSLAAIFVSRNAASEAVGKIISGAFSWRSAGGGALGYAVYAGCMRGLLSNEAGCGTAPMAHASADTDDPERQGLWGIFEVFADTVVLCTVTALVIVIGWDSASAYASNPIMMTVAAYSQILGGWAGWFLGAAVFLFGFSTVICWGHYGVLCVRQIFKRKTAVITAVYAVLYATAAFFGAGFAPNGIWGAADLALGGMTLINIPVLWLMRDEIGTIAFSRRNRREL